MNISRLKTKDLPGFRVGDHIVVQEKIDGANFSIRYSPDGRSIFIICAFEMFLEEYNTNKLQVPNARLSFI